jgi:hypothetical protein
MSRSTFVAYLLFLLPVAAGCGSKPNDPFASATCSGNPEQIAYIVARDSDDITAIDLSCMQVTRSAKIGTQMAHMGELNSDGSKLYVDSESTNETVVVKTADFRVLTRLTTPTHPTHIAATRDGSNRLVAVAEGADSIFVIDGNNDQVIKTIPGFYLPHFPRMTPDGKYVWVANLQSSHLTRVDLSTLEIVGHIALDGYDVPPSAVKLPGEDGFADAQVDQVTGLLYAAHRGTGKVLVVDTASNTKQGELQVGQRPWIVYAEHPFGSLARRHMVPNFYDQTASVINASDPLVLGTLNVADQETYGVNYSPKAPGQAFLMNREKHQVAVVDLSTMQPVDDIDVGGTTETASTSADGKYIVATVSSANKVVVIDAATHAIVKSFDHVGTYPWSVTMLRGQNYCH